MLAVRYVALAALVVWLGGLVAATFGGVLPSLPILSFVCGAVILICLFLVKFIGPPPHAFIPRATLTALMLVLLGAAALMPTSAGALMLADLVLGFVLLFWYVRE